MRQQSRISLTVGPLTRHKLRKFPQSKARRRGKLSINEGKLIATNYQELAFGYRDGIMRDVAYNEKLGITSCARLPMRGLRHEDARVVPG